MKLIVCVKQVPDTSGKVAVKPDGTLDRASMDTIINPDDANAVEAALQLRDELGEGKVVVMTMGPMQVLGSGSLIPMPPARSLPPLSTSWGSKKMISSSAVVRQSTAIPPRSDLRSLKSWVCPRSPMLPS
mgnify:CR=1 FL=1